MNNAQPSCSSSRRMCIETADWVLWTRSAARVNEPVSTMARKDRNWSVSSMVSIHRDTRSETLQTFVGPINPHDYIWQCSDSEPDLTGGREAPARPGTRVGSTKEFRYDAVSSPTRLARRSASPCALLAGSRRRGAAHHDPALADVRLRAARHRPHPAGHRGRQRPAA